MPARALAAWPEWTPRSVTEWIVDGGWWIVSLASLAMEPEGAEV
jgi:hypothetical protein